MKEKLKECQYIKQIWRGTVICGIMNENQDCVGTEHCCIYEDITKRDKRIAELEEMLRSVLEECHACDDAEPRDCRLEEQIKKTLTGKYHENH